MNAWIAQLPKPALAFLVILLGVAFFLISDPPIDSCKVQIDEFEERNEDDFLRVKEGNRPASKLVKLKKQCVVTNTVGGCLEYFQMLEMLLAEIQTISHQCQSEVLGLAPVREGLFEAIELMSEIAWGDEPPDFGLARFGWFDSYEIHIFCDIKTFLEEQGGPQALAEMRERLMVELPGAADLQRDDVWGRMVLSTRCDALPF